MSCYMYVMHYGTYVCIQIVCMEINVPSHSVCISSFTDCVLDLNAAVLPSHGGNSTGNTYMYTCMSFFVPLTEVHTYVHMYVCIRQHLTFNVNLVLKC